MYQTPLFTVDAITHKTRLHIWEGNIAELAESMFVLYKDIVRSELKLSNVGRDFTDERLRYIDEQQLSPELKQQIIEFISLKKVDSLI